MAGEGLARAVLLVDDEADALAACTQALRRERYRVDTASRPAEALTRVRASSYDAAVVDLKMPEMSGIDLLRAMRAIDPELAVVIVTGYATIETAVAAMKEGATDYLAKPFTPEELRLAVGKAVERHALMQENRELRERLGAGAEAPPIVGDGAAMTGLRRLIARVADTDSTVLICGETGTGKELVARELHARSRRAAQAFIGVDCAAVPAELLESEFFGHEKGAFTGAVRRRTGSFELAHGGTLFLDEIANMSVELQAKLLRALQEREIQPLGGERKIPVDVRILAATNRNLKDAVRAGSFRDDLYYRLNVIPLALPPLRERTDDIPALVAHFLAKHARRLNRRLERIDAAALAILAAYPWPGNVRELESTIERAMTLADGPVLGAAAFGHLVDDGRAASAAVAGRGADAAHAAELPTLEQVEAEYILEVLKATRWNRREASRILGISTVTLWRKVGARPVDDPPS